MDVNQPTSSPTDAAGAAFRVLGGVLLFAIVLGVAGSSALAALAAGLGIVLLGVRRRRAVPWWEYMLAAAPGGVAVELLNSVTMSAPATVEFETLQVAVGDGMLIGFTVGFALSLAISGIRSWQPGSVSWIGITAGALVFMGGAMSPYGGCTKEKAYIAAMKSDLRNLVVAQETFYAKHRRYAPTLRALSEYEASAGVTVRVLVPVGADGWYAWAVHNGTPATCTLYVGDGVPQTAGAPAEPACS